MRAIRSAGAVPLTWDDLQELPDDGYRRELVHGQLLVTPSPTMGHQNVVFQLGLLLGNACPVGLKILPAPCDWKLSPETVFEPDLLVIDRADYHPAAVLTGTPRLVVEVLSPSTRDTDLSLKRLEYERAGVPAYWLVDTDPPCLTVLQLVDGTFSEVARVEGPASYRADLPFPVTVVPADLLH
ncbi:MAG: Uma2 family endonuclease [Acidimicrobiales bacterium]